MALIPRNMGTSLQSARILVRWIHFGASLLFCAIRLCTVTVCFSESDGELVRLSESDGGANTFFGK